MFSNILLSNSLSTKCCCSIKSSIWIILYSPGNHLFSSFKTNWANSNGFTSNSIRVFCLMACKFWNRTDKYYSYLVSSCSIGRQVLLFPLRAHSIAHFTHRPFLWSFGLSFTMKARAIHSYTKGENSTKN